MSTLLRWRWSCWLPPGKPRAWSIHRIPDRVRPAAMGCDPGRSSRLGVRVDGLPTRTAGTAADEIFVEALYQTVLRRLPTPPELAFEVAKLRAGVGREWMIRAFARRPEAARLLLNVRGRQLHARAGRWCRRRWFLSARVRDLVVAAESREISLLMARSRELPAEQIKL